MDSINSTFGIGRLIAKHLTNALDAAEQQQLDAWLKADEKNAAIFNRIVVHESLAAALIEMQQINTELALANVKMRTGQQPEAKPTYKAAKLWKRYFGVAAAVAAIVFGIWFYTSRHSGTQLSGTEGRDLTNDIAPGKNTAVLIVNGKQTQLSDAKAGIVVNEDIKYNDGTTINPSLRGGTTWQSEPLTLTTPKGGTYSIILQDGTKVWLNADSKLEVLSNFWNKTQRTVALTGEAYFEVATAYTTLKGRRTKQPFLVVSNGQRIEVLGTRFNVSVYPGDPVATTTLLEGSIALNKTLLKPNQQAERMGKGGLIISNVDASRAIAWKNGKFAFENEALYSVMRKVERWYNVTVIFNNEELKHITVDGSLSRYSNVSRILKSIEFAGKVKFKIEGQKIFVTD